MDETALSKALAGRRNFSSLEVARIAERLGLRTDALFADDEDQYRQTLTFAARLQAGAVDGDGVREAVGLAAGLWELDRLLGELGCPAGSPPALPSVAGGGDIAQGTELAHRIRGDLTEPLPAQIDGLAEWIECRLGADVCITRLPAGVDGLALTRARRSGVLIY
jgi:hypothetical protein